MWAVVGGNRTHPDPGQTPDQTPKDKPLSSIKTCPGHCICYLGLTPSPLFVRVSSLQVLVRYLTYSRTLRFGGLPGAVLGGFDLGVFSYGGWTGAVYPGVCPTFVVGM